MQSDATLEQINYTIEVQLERFTKSFSEALRQQIEAADAKIYSQYRSEIIQDMVDYIDETFSKQVETQFKILHHVFAKSLDEKTEKWEASAIDAELEHLDLQHIAKTTVVMGSTGFGTPSPQIVTGPNQVVIQPKPQVPQDQDFSLANAMVLGRQAKNRANKRGIEEPRSKSPEDQDFPKPVDYMIDMCEKAETGFPDHLASEPPMFQEEWQEEEEDTQNIGIGKADDKLNYQLCVVSINSLEIQSLKQKMGEFLQSLAPKGAIGPVCLVQDQRSLQWYEQRGLRLTASTFGKMFKRRALDPPETLEKLVHAMLNPKKYSGKIPALEYGIENEAAAREDYEKKTGNNVEETGFWTRADCGFIGGSPDGIVIDRITGNRGLLEIKCPYSGRKLTIKEYAETPRTVLESNGKGGYNLKQSHEYYHQMQGCMYILNMSWCDFVVRTERDIHIERIRRDNSLISKMMSKLKEMYIRFFLPSLATGRHKQTSIEYPLLDSHVYKQHFASLVKLPPVEII